MSNKVSIKNGSKNEETIKKEYKKDKVRQLREGLGLRRTEFGAKIGYTYQQINRVEGGILPVSEEMADKICSEYGVNRDWLSGKKGAEAPEFEEGSRERGKRLRKAYEESGYSQREFARRTHTSVALLNDVISGRNQMTIRYARKIEETLGVGADWLLYGDEAAKKYPCSESMIKFLKSNPDVREEVWKKMKEREGV